MGRYRCREGGGGGWGSGHPESQEHGRESNGNPSAAWPDGSSNIFQYRLCRNERRVELHCEFWRLILPANIHAFHIPTSSCSTPDHFVLRNLFLSVDTCGACASLTFLVAKKGIFSVYCLFGCLGDNNSCCLSPILT